MTQPYIFRQRWLTEKAQQKPLMVSATTLALDVIQQMSQSSVSYALVQEQQRLVGIFTAEDLVQVIASDRVLATITIAEVMTRSVITLTEAEAENLLTVLQQFRQHPICYLPVLNTEGAVVEVITPETTQNALEPIITTLSTGTADCTGIDQERQQTKNLLSQKTAELEAIFQALPDAVIFADVNRCIRSVNPAAIAIFGYEPTELIGKPAEVLYARSEDYHEQGKKRFNPSAKKSSQRYEIAYRRKNGQTFICEAVSSIVQDSSEQILGFVGIIRDITKRKQAGAALQQSEARYRAIVEDQTELIIRYLPDTTVLFVNDSFCRYFGLNRDDILYKSYQPVIYKADRDQVNQLIQSMSPENPTVTIENRVVVGHTVRWTQWVNRMLFDEQGNFMEFQAVGRDITDLKQTEKALRQSEARNQALIQAIPDLLIHMRSDGTYLNIFNQGSIHLLNPEQSYGKYSVYEILPPEIAQKRMEFTQQALRTGELQVYDYQITINGKTQIEEARVIPYARDEVLLIVRDITERKRAEEELHQLNTLLQESNRELQNFAFIASHDIKEPLRTIRSFSTLLESHAGNQLDDRGRDYIKRMQNAAKRLQMQIDDLLSLSQVTTQAKPFVPVNLNQVLQAVLTGLEVTLQETGAIVEVDVLPEIEADPSQMHQLLQNLLSNALKFRGQNPPVVRIFSQLLHEPNDATCQILIEDNGIGFDEKHLDRIFQIFERLHSYDEYEGTGIGLAICRKIVERHKGKITANSAPGKGTMFTLTLPIRQIA